MEVVVIDFVCPAAAPHPAFGAVSLNHGVIHVVMPPAPARSDGVIAATVQHSGRRVLEVVVLDEEPIRSAEVRRRAKRSVAVLGLQVVAIKGDYAAILAHDIESVSPGVAELCGEPMEGPDS